MLETSEIGSLSWDIIFSLKKQLLPSLASNNKPYQRQHLNSNIWQ